jgi:hypothetical protein
MNQLLKIGISAAAFLVLISTQAGATAITFFASGTGASGEAISASATFDFSGDNLTITLVNTAIDDDAINGKDLSANTLTGLFFDLTGSPTLDPFSATVAPGAIAGAPCSPGPCTLLTTDVGGEFGYATVGLPGGVGYGIASSGFDLFGDGSFDQNNPGVAGLNLDNPDAVNGANFGIISSLVDYHPNPGLANDPVIVQQVVFILTGVQGLTAASVSNVSFQYGTDLNEPNISCCEQDVPEPGTLMVLGWGLAVLGLYSGRRRR